MFEETNTASGHHMDVDLELGDPPGDEKKGERFFFCRRDPLFEIYAFIIHPKKIIKSKIMKVGFLVVSEGSHPTPPNFPNFFDAKNFLLASFFWLSGTLKLEEKSTFGAAVGFRTLLPRKKT